MYRRETLRTPQRTWAGPTRKAERAPRSETDPNHDPTLDDRVMPALPHPEVWERDPIWTGLYLPDGARIMNYPDPIGFLADFFEYEDLLA